MMNWKKTLVGFICVITLTSCGYQQEEKENPSPVQEVHSVQTEREKAPTIPDNLPEDLEYLFDFKFAERYDAKVSGAFSLDFSGAADLKDPCVALYEQWHDSTKHTEMREYSSDGMTPYSIRRYFYPEGLIIGTHRYEADDLEYISFLWTNMAGVRTEAGIGVGSKEEDIMAAYPTKLYYIPGDQTEEDLLSFTEADVYALNFDYALVWQPFTSESNECRDITFYIKDEKVTSMEIMAPFELRYVYGFDGGPDLADGSNQ